MTKPAELRKRLESTSFPNLGAMMEGYAQAAAELAKGEFGQKLDFTADSIDSLLKSTSISRCGCGAATWAKCFAAAMQARGR
jgi:hypothetical protein